MLANSLQSVVKCSVIKKYFSRRPNPEILIFRDRGGNAATLRTAEPSVGGRKEGSILPQPGSGGISPEFFKIIMHPGAVWDINVEMAEHYRMN